MPDLSRGRGGLEPGLARAPGVPVARGGVWCGSTAREPPAARLALSPGVLLDLDCECADRGRQALVVPDEGAQLDRFAVVETRLNGAPGRVRERAPGEQLVADGQQRPLTLGEAVRGRAVGDARDLVWRQPDAQRDRHVLLVIIPAQAFERSKLIAPRAPSASFSHTLIGGSSCIRRPPE
jgi:hypothetical protein